MREFVMLLGVAIAMVGALAFLFFWPMTRTHLHDRHPQAHAGVALGDLRWFLLGRYRALHDPALNGLALPAQLGLWTVVLGLALAAVLFLARLP